MSTDSTQRTVTIRADDESLEGMLALPPNARGLVLFAHGSGSSRLSPRNNYVAQVLRSGGVGTLLFDLLSAEEDRDYANRFAIGLLAERLVAATRWVVTKSDGVLVHVDWFGKEGQPLWSVELERYEHLARWDPRMTPLFQGFSDPGARRGLHVGDLTAALLRPCQP